LGRLTQNWIKEEAKQPLKKAGLALKNPPKKTHPKKPKKTHLKNPLKVGFFGYFKF
jgi:hypothetical protein